MSSRSSSSTLNFSMNEASSVLGLIITYCCDGFVEVAEDDTTCDVDECDDTFVAGEVIEDGQEMPSPGMSLLS